MAYMRKLHTDCDWHFCKKRATHEVFGRRNESYGKFCAPHARKKVEHLKQEEA